MSIYPKEFEPMSQMILQNVVPLRSTAGKEQFYAFVQKILDNQNNEFERLFEIYQYSKSLIQVFSEAYKEANKAKLINKDALAKEKLLGKNYNRSGQRVTIDELDYIKDGYGLNYTDFISNMETLSKGVYDYENDVWLINKDEMNEYMKGLTSIVQFSYTDEISKRDFTIAPSVRWYKVPVDNVKHIVSKTDTLISTYKQVLDLYKKSKKLVGVIKTVLKEIIINQLTETKQVVFDSDIYLESIKKEKGSQASYIDALTFDNELVIEGKNYGSESAKLNFVFSVSWFPLRFQGKIAQYYKKEAKFADMRKKKTKEGLLNIMKTLRAELASRWYFDKYGVYNIFVTKLDVKKFPELLETDRYKDISKEKTIYKLKTT